MNPERKARRSARVVKWLDKQEREVWQRRDDFGDTAESFPYFLAYRDCKGRTLERARRGLDERSTVPGGVLPTMAKMREWHDAHQWAMRVAEYDMHMDKIRIEEREIALKRTEQERAAEQLQITDRITSTLQKEADKLDALSDGSDAPVLKPAEILKGIETVVKTQRLVTDQSTENVKADIDLSGLSREALEELAEAEERARSGK